MTELHQRRKGASKAAWGYFFLFFDLDLNGFQILPDFIAYLLFLDAIRLLEDEERELGLLRSFARILAAIKFVEWIAPMFGVELSVELGLFWELPAFLCELLALYFQFQFLTNLASIAARYQAPGTHTDRTLLHCRTYLTVFQTVITLCGMFLGDLAYTSLVQQIVLVLLILNGITGLVMMFVLFKLRRIFARAPLRSEDDEDDEYPEEYETDEYETEENDADGYESGAYAPDFDEMTENRHGGLLPE